MYRSWFEYSITKPYPYQWFTPLTFIGGVILTIIFCILNLAAQGYQYRTIYTSDPNTTLVANTKWFMEAPFNWGTSLRPACDPFLLSVGHHFFTTNLGFSYEVTAISRYDEVHNQTDFIASVPYLNNTLQECRTKRVTINLERADLAPTTSWWFSWSKSDTFSWVQCSVEPEIDLTFRVAYSGSSGGLGRYDYVIKDNYTTHASVWWGTRLIDAYWNGLMSVMSETQRSVKGLIMRGNLDYVWNEAGLKRSRSFDFSFFFFFENSLIDDDSLNGIRMLNNKTVYSSAALTEGLFWAKIMHSTLMADLGNKDSPNFVLNTEDLKYLLSGAGDFVREAPGIFNGASYDTYAKIPQPEFPDNTNATRVLITESYDFFGERMGPLGTREARIHAQYPCQIPVQKSRGTMILSIVIANLVVLQAAWRLLNLATQQLVTRRQETAMFCEGCQKIDFLEIGMTRFGPNTSNSLNVYHSLGDSTQRLTDSPSPNSRTQSSGPIFERQRA